MISLFVTAPFSTGVLFSSLTGMTGFTSFSANGLFSFLSLVFLTKQLGSSSATKGKMSQFSCQTLKYQTKSFCKTKRNETVLNFERVFIKALDKTKEYA